MNEKKETKKAFFLTWVVETVVGCALFVIFFANVFFTLYLGIPTTSWDVYSVLIWGFIPFIVLAAFVSRVFITAKQGYVPLV